MTSQRTAQPTARPVPSPADHRFAPPVVHALPRPAPEPASFAQIW